MGGKKGSIYKENRILVGAFKIDRRVRTYKRGLYASITIPWLAENSRRGACSA